MHILIISHACSLPQNQTLFALASKSRGWQVTMVLPERWRNEYGLYNEARLLPGFEAELVAAPVLKNGSVPLHAYRMNATRLLKRLNPDVVYSHNEPYALSSVQWCYANTRSINRPFGFFSCQNLVKRYPIPFRQGEAWVYRRSSFAFPITKAVERVHRTKGYTGAACELPLGFDSEVYAARGEIESRHLSKNGSFKLAFIGRVVEEKGLATLAKALGYVRDLDWQLVLVGSGPYESQVKQALHDADVSDRVSWRGFLPHDEVASFYETVDAIVLPSESRANWTEQFGRVLVEAMACGTPVIGSDSGEIPNIISSSGGGLVFQEANAISCSQAIRKLITDSKGRAQMAKSGHDYVLRNYALTALAERFASAIERACH